MPEEALFCPSCGSRAVCKCPNCGKETAGDDVRFCPECGASFSKDVGVGSETSGSAPAYYCARGSERIGPLTAAEIEAKIKAGELGYGDSVVSVGMTDWTPLEMSVFADFITKNAPIPVQWSKVNNSMAWLIAFDWMIFALLSGLFALPWFFCMLMRIAIVFLDRKILKEAGHDNGKYIWWILISPVYLYKRASRLKQRKTYFWVSILSLLIYVGFLFVFVAGTVVGSEILK